MNNTSVNAEMLLGKSTHWLAYEPGLSLEQMRRVVAKTLEYMNGDGALDTKQIWVDATNDNRHWDLIRRKFVDRLTGNEL